MANIDGDAEMQAGDDSVHLLDLPDALLLHALCQLRALADVAACRASCTCLARVGADDAVWANLGLHLFGLRERAVPPTADGPGAPTASFMQAARAWSGLASRLELETFRGASGGLDQLAPSATLAAGVWMRLERWCAANMPELAQTLRPPATPADWREFEAAIGLPALPAVCYAM
jgi:hypothetical protein